MSDTGPVVANAGPLIVLVAAKQHGRLTAVRPFLEQMRAKGYFLAPSVVSRTLREAGE